MSLEELKRKVAADPEDEAAFMSQCVALERAGGDGREWLEPLATIKRWKSSSSQLQDRVIERCARWVRSKGLKLLRVASFHNYVTSHCQLCQGSGVIEHFTGDFGVDVCPRPGCREGYVREHSGCRTAVFLHEESGIELSLIPGAQERSGRQAVDPFLLSRWPVTAGQWYEAGQGSASGVPRLDSAGKGADRPKVGLEKFMVQSLWSHYGFRLPTSDEWLHACAGDVMKRYYFGSFIDDDHVWHALNRMMSTEMNRPIPPREHEHMESWNQFGLVDMIGNVMEWLGDETERRIPGGPEGLVVSGSYQMAPETFLMGALEACPIGSRVALQVTGFRAACSIKEVA